MKKLIGIVLAVVLVAGGLGGFAYANNNSHEAATGQKLIGTGVVGKAETAGSIFYNHVTFRITNPDCVEDITITQMSIISGNGTAIYEGPCVRTVPDGDGEMVPVVMDRPMEPHEVWTIALVWCMPDGDGGWLDRVTAVTQPAHSYTLELAWEAKGSCCPLTGWQEWSKYQIRPGTTPPPEKYRFRSQGPMVNMKQRVGGGD